MPDVVVRAPRSSAPCSPPSTPGSRDAADRSGSASYAERTILADPARRTAVAGLSPRPDRRVRVPVPPALRRPRPVLDDPPATRPTTSAPPSPGRSGPGTTVRLAAPLGDRGPIVSTTRRHDHQGALTCGRTIDRRAVLFTTQPGTGHLHPLLPSPAARAPPDHDVAFATSAPDGHRRITAAASPTTSVGRPWTGGSTCRPAGVPRGRARSPRTPSATRRAVGGATSPRDTGARRRPGATPPAAASGPPDVSMTRKRLPSSAASTSQSGCSDSPRRRPSHRAATRRSTSARWSTSPAHRSRCTLGCSGAGAGLVSSARCATGPPVPARGS